MSRLSATNAEAEEAADGKKESVAELSFLGLLFDALSAGLTAFFCAPWHKVLLFLLFWGVTQFHFKDYKYLL